MAKINWQSLYVKLFLSSFLFILFLIGFFLSLQFYSKTIVKKLENIANLKKEIIQNQTSQEKELKFKQLINFFEKQSGKEIQTVLFEVQKVLNPDFEKTKEFFLKKFNDEGWKIINSNFNFQEGRLNFVLGVTSQDLSRFLDFLQNQPLIIKVENLKIEKAGTDYQIELSLKLK